MTCSARMTMPRCWRTRTTESWVRRETAAWCGRFFYALLSVSRDDVVASREGNRRVDARSTHVPVACGACHRCGCTRCLGGKKFAQIDAVAGQSFTARKKNSGAVVDAGGACGWHWRVAATDLHACATHACKKKIVRFYRGFFAFVFFWLGLWACSMHMAIARGGHGPACPPVGWMKNFSSE